MAVHAFFLLAEHQCVLDPGLWPTASPIYVSSKTPYSNLTTCMAKGSSTLNPLPQHLPGQHLKDLNFKPHHWPTVLHAHASAEPSHMRACPAPASAARRIRFSRVAVTHLKRILVGPRGDERAHDRLPWQVDISIVST